MNRKLSWRFNKSRINSITKFLKQKTCDAVLSEIKLFRNHFFDKLSSKNQIAELESKKILVA